MIENLNRNYNLFTSLGIKVKIKEDLKFENQ
jgi:hypothetical protein